jgi:hypothetical protein
MMLGIETFEECGTLRAIRDVSRFTEDLPTGSQLGSRSLSFVLSATDENGLASTVENDLGGSFAYTTRSSDNNEFLALKFSFH